jgi:hypothetical protein
MMVSHWGICDLATTTREKSQWRPNSRHNSLPKSIVYCRNVGPDLPGGIGDGRGKIEAALLLGMRAASILFQLPIKPN